MSEQYRLVFAGEVTEGQHPAVVKKRLAGVLKLSDERMAILFSGKPVVIKRDIDAATAARFAEVFEKAGAVLKVVAAKGQAAPPAPAESSGQTQPTSAPPGEPAAAPAGSDEMGVLPVGADILSPDEREQVVDANIDTDHLSIQGAVFAVPEAEEEIAAPNTDHLSLAEAGARMSDEEEEVIAEIDVDFSVAETGAMMSAEKAEQPPSPVDLDTLNFDVAEPGAEMDTRKKGPPPPAPDTSHLQLDDE